MRPRRLILRIYLVTLAQFLAVALTFYVVRIYLLRPPPHDFGPGKWEAYVLRQLAAERDDPAALARHLDRVRKELDLRLTLYAANGELLASSHPTVPPPLAPLKLAELRAQHFIHTKGSEDRRGTVSVAVEENGQLVAYGMVDHGHPPPRFLAVVPLVILGAILVFVLIGSVLFARALAHPLSRIAEVARSFGKGQLDARLGFRRKDEFGDVAHAFDEMAGRVTHLLRGQRELLANVSHELRTPLSRIRVALDLAAEGDPQTAQEMLADITEDWGDLERLVEDVLAAARLELGPESPSAPLLRRERLELAPLFDKAVSRFRLLHPGHQLTVEATESLPSLEGDASMLRRVLDNLLDNASKYSEPGSAVTLRASHDARHLSIAVADHGIGIEASDLPNLFTPFFRTDRSRARTTGGVGLGLALARRIVQAHGGTIDASSRVGEGTVVQFRLPLVDELA
jgi:two-component system OmpR family sensor kinase